MQNNVTYSVGDLMNLSEIRYGQEILIEKVKYEVLNMTKFKEKSSYWLEYKLRRLEDNKIFYLISTEQSQIPDKHCKKL